MLKKQDLRKLYFQEGKSKQEIANVFGCSVNQVSYWMNVYRLQPRSISQALFRKHYPHGDPFCFRAPSNRQEAFLFGLGMGLYWGEGTKANRSSVRLGNSDPRLVRAFMRFLIELYGVKKESLRFSLQIFSDLDKNAATRYWVKALGVKSGQFTKPTITPYRSLGTYRQKSAYGVVTLYCHNTRLKNLLMEQLEKVSARTFKISSNTP